MNNELRMKAERDMVRATIDACIAAGWTLRGASNGEERIRTIDADKAIECAFACDEGHVYFGKGEARAWFWIVLGNSGWDVVADYTVNLDAIMDSPALVQRGEEWESVLLGLACRIA